jgi:hypothetical protein
MSEATAVAISSFFISCVPFRVWLVKRRERTARKNDDTRVVRTAKKVGRAASPSLLLCANLPFFQAMPRLAQCPAPPLRPSNAGLIAHQPQSGAPSGGTKACFVIRLNIN